jgi:hypothetical protein
VRIRTVVSFVAAAVFTLVLAAPAAAQGMFGVGLALTNDNGTGKGFAANVSKDIKQTTNVGIGPVGDFSFTSDNGFHWTTYAGGVRINGHAAGKKKVIPFGEFLIGASSFGCDGCGSETDLSFLFGGGVHVPLNEMWNLLVQFDIVNVHFDGATENGKRFVIGVSKGFGKK